MRAENDQVSRVGYWQHKARCVGDERADQQIGQRLDASSGRGGIDGRRQHNGCCVVGQEHRYQYPDAINDQKQSSRRTSCVTNGEHRQPIELALLARDFRK